jgi:hypothetical protein
VQIRFRCLARPQPGHHLGRVQHGQHQVAHVLINGCGGDVRPAASTFTTIRVLLQT